ncbi:MAG: FliA/WhiG family RNA polymerase sigma factor [Candidatus Eisenbacteria bacterium]|nr:FliA/WhiG family RNA polymerase sigma factor [Candidatus Eisenbacteria bacterium]
MDSIETVWRKYQVRRNKRLRDRLILEYMPLVKYVAGRLAVGLPPSVQIEDLIGSGTLGLMSAVERYDPGRDNKFSTFAISRIRGAMLDELRSMDWVPRSVRRKARQLEETYNRLESRYGRAASDQEVAKAMDIGMQEYFQLLEDVRGATLLSLNEHSVSGDDNSPTQVHDTVPDKDVIDPIAILEVQKMRKVLDGSLDNLPERERLVLILYYYEEMTLKEIGSILGVSESRVSQIHTKSITRLRSRLRADSELLASAQEETRALNLSEETREEEKRDYARAMLGIA